MNTNFIKFLFALKNASLSKKETLVVDYTFAREKIIKVLYIEGLVQSFFLTVNSLKEHDFIVVKFRYSSDKSHLRYLTLISKPSHVKYMKIKDLCNISDKKLMVFLSTKFGFLSLSQCKQFKVGGKVLFAC